MTKHEHKVFMAGIATTIVMMYQKFDSTYDAEVIYYETNYKPSDFLNNDFIDQYDKTILKEFFNKIGICDIK